MPKIRRWVQLVFALVLLLGGSIARAEPVEKPYQTVVPIIAVTLTGPGRIQADETATFAVTATIADFSTSATRLTVVLSEPLRFIEADESGTFAAETNAIIWNLGTAAPGSITKQFSVRADAPIENGTIALLAATLDTAENEPVQSALQTTVASAPRVSVTAILKPRQVLAGGTTVLEATIANNGTDAAENLVVTLALPAEIRADNTAEKSISLKLGNLAAQDKTTVDIPVSGLPETKPSSYDLLLTVTGNNFDPIRLTEKLTIAAPNLGAATSPAASNAEQALVAPTGQVLGAETTLAETGMTFGDWLLMTLATALITAGVTTFLFYPFPSRSER